MTSESQIPLVDGFVDLVPIGRGGSSTVYSATEMAFDRRVALKVLSASRSATRNIDREIQALGRLTALPGIVPAYRATRTSDGRPVLVMQLMERSLADRIKQSGPLPAPEVLRVFGEIASALDGAHGIGVHHRDLKPENILLTSRGDARLADLGIAEMTGVDDGTTAMHSLTPPHAPPERLLGTETDPVRADIYSLASTIFTALTGAPPFGTTEQGGVHGLTTRVVEEPLPRPTGMDARVHEVFSRALSKAPAERHESAVAFLDDLTRAFVDARHEGSSTPGRRGQVQSSRDKVAAAVLITAVVLGVGAGIALRSGGTDSGAPTSTSSTTTTVPVVELPDEPFLTGDATSISVSSGHACVELDDARAGCWGTNTYLDFDEYGIEGAAEQQMNLYAPFPYPMRTDPVRDIEVGSDWTGNENLCVVTEQGAVLCRGWSISEYSDDMNAEELNRSDLVRPVRGVDRAVEVAVGSDHACALIEDGTVVCWGDNEFGQLGDGTRDGSVVARQVQGLAGATQLTAGGQHTCALRADGTAWCWGVVRPPFESELTAWQVPGLPPLQTIATGGQHSCGVADGQLWCWGLLDELMGDATLKGRREPMHVALEARATAVSVGRSSACATDADTAVWCWGGSESRPMTRIVGVSRAIDVAVEDELGCALLEGGAVSCWGYTTGPVDEQGWPQGSDDAIPVRGLGGI